MVRIEVGSGDEYTKIGNWEVDLGFVYHTLPEEWDNLDEAFKRARPVWNMVGVHLWHEITDEGFMLEIRLVGGMALDCPAVIFQPTGSRTLVTAMSAEI